MFEIGAGVWRLHGATSDLFGHAETPHTTRRIIKKDKWMGDKRSSNNNNIITGIERQKAY